MPRFGKRSMANLEGVHPLLVDWAFRLVTKFDITVSSGVRDLTTQRQYVASGASKTMNSMHLLQTDGYGHAIDIAPYPINYKRTRNFDIMAGIGLCLSWEMDVPIRWGGDWDRDLDPYDQSFNDTGHFELYTPEITMRTA